ncbi:hypothetical protein MMC28_002347 [Mycoblastus sanguinarius]|nr:hypothetical protein [Mycoblastus sanguinarius]
MRTTASTGLPNELWDEVLSYLTKRDLKSLRLAGKWHVTDTATSSLFETAYLAARKGVFDAFTGLASHSVLRHHVKQLIYDSSWIDPRIPGQFTDDWTQAIEAVHDDKQLAVAFALQEDIQTRKLRPALEKSFEAFPNLQRIIYADMARTAGLPGDTWESCSDLSSEQNPHVQRILFRQFCNKVALCCLNNVCGKAHSNFFRRQYGGLSILLELMRKHPPASLEELSIGNGSRSAGSYPAGIPDFFLYNTSKTFPALKYVLTYLRKLDLTVCFPTMTSTFESAVSPSATNWENGLRRLLGTAEVLEEMSLSGNSSPGILSLSLDGSWPDKALGSLRVLHLRASQAGYRRLSNIIWCNRHTLQHLQLDDFELLTESWPAVMKFCQKQAPSLTVVYGFTWYQGKVCRVDWAPKPDTDGDDNDEAQSDDQDSSYSDGEDFVHTSHVVGYRRRERLAGDPEADDGEYEDVIEVTKALREDSDEEELEYDSDDDSAWYSDEDEFSK